MPNLTFEWPGGCRSLGFDNEKPILDSVLKADFPVDHSCLRGDCLRCSALLIHGEATDLSTDDHLVAGRSVLLCQLKAKGDLKLELANNPYEDMIAPKLFPAKIVGLDPLSHDVVRIRLVTPKGQVLRYKGGQYIDLILKPDTRRSYSIYNVDAESREIECHIRIVSGGRISNWLNKSASVGDLIQIHGPHGRFVYRDHLSASRTWFFATGTGIVPILSMLRSINQHNLLKLGIMTLFWGNRKIEDTYKIDGLHEFLKSNKVSLIMAYSRESALSEMSYVTDGIKDISPSDLLFAAGNPAMVSDVRQLAISKGTNPNRIFSDAFAFDASNRG